MEAAARAYFGIASADLTLAQASLWAALPNAPMALNLHTGWDALKERQAKPSLQSAKASLKLNASEVFDIGLEITTAPPINHVVITDPLPADLEAVNTSFQTSNPAIAAPRDSWQIGYQQLGRDRIPTYADQLPTGVYELHYLARSVPPCTYH